MALSLARSVAITVAAALAALVLVVAWSTLSAPRLRGQYLQVPHVYARSTPAPVPELRLSPLQPHRGSSLTPLAPQSGGERGASTHVREGGGTSTGTTAAASRTPSFVTHDGTPVAVSHPTSAATRAHRIPMVTPRAQPAAPPTAAIEPPARGERPQMMRRGQHFWMPSGEIEAGEDEPVAPDLHAALKAYQDTAGQLDTYIQAVGLGVPASMWHDRRRVGEVLTAVAGVAWPNVDLATTVGGNPWSYRASTRDEHHGVCVVGFGDGHVAAMALAEAARRSQATPVVLAFDLQDTVADGIGANHLEGRFNRQLHVVLVGHSDSDTTSVGAYLDAHTELRCSVILIDGTAVRRWEGDSVATLLSRFYDRSATHATVVLYNAQPASIDDWDWEVNVGRVREAKHANVAVAHRRARVSMLRAGTYSRDVDRYFVHRASVRRGCGDVCDVAGGHTAAVAKVLRGAPAPVPLTTTRVDCPALWGNAAIDARGWDSPPPGQVPAPMRRDFEQGGTVEVVRAKRVFTPPPGTARWTQNRIDDFVRQARTPGLLEGTIGAEAVSSLRSGIGAAADRLGGLSGKRVLVLGGAKPWVEACVLAAGDSTTEVISLPWVSVTSVHKQVRALSHATARRLYMLGELPRFHVVVSYAALASAGLGRFGEAVNPWADAQALARAWCVTVEDGLLVLGVPLRGADKKAVVKFNEKRVYDARSLSRAAANWVHIKRAGGGHTSVHVFARYGTKADAHT